MADPINPLLLKILDACKAQSPEPLYPKPFAIAENLDRKHLDDAFDHLRIHGLVQFTDWVAGHGQGYALTEEGDRILQNPVLLSRPLPKPESRSLETSAEHAASTWERGEEIRNSLLQPIRPVVTRALLFANIAIFALGWYLASERNIGGVYLAGSSGSKEYNLLLIEMGSCYPPGILAGEWWRLLAYAFLHIGGLHLLLNMYFLYNVGPIVEGLYGSWRYFLLYMIGAMTGGVGAYLANSVAAGASGALSGLLLAMAVWLFLSKAHFPREFVSRWQGSILTNIVLLVFISLLPGVSWAGHLGGAVGGAIAAAALHVNRFGVGWRRGMALVVVGLIPLAALASLSLSYDPIRENTAFYIRFQDRHQELDREFLEFYNEFGVKILAEGPKSLGDKKVDAEAKLDPIVRKLKTLGGQVKALDPRSPDLQGFIPFVQRYIDAQITLGESFQRALRQPDDWNVEKYNAVERQIHTYQASRMRLRGGEGAWLKKLPPS